MDLLDWIRVKDRVRRNEEYRASLEAEFSPQDMLDATYKLKHGSYIKLMTNGVRFEMLGMYYECIEYVECPSRSWEMILRILMTGEVSGGPCIIYVESAEQNPEDDIREAELQCYLRTSGMLEHMGEIDGCIIGGVTRICVPVVIETCQNPPMDDCPWSNRVPLGSVVCRVVIMVFNATLKIQIRRTRDSCLNR